MKNKIVLVSFSLILIFLLAACGTSSDEQLSVGDDAPDFTLPAADGRTMTLSDYRGQPVLLFFHMANG